MNYIKVTSIEHLDELLEKHVSSEFVIRSGVLRSSKNIQKQFHLPKKKWSSR